MLNFTEFYALWGANFCPHIHNCVHSHTDSEDDYKLKMVILLTVILIFLCISVTLLFFICSFNILEKSLELKQQSLFFLKL